MQYLQTGEWMEISFEIFHPFSVLKIIQTAYK